MRVLAVMFVSFSATSGLVILGEKNEYVSQHTIENCSACVNVHNSREGQGLVSNK